jgi:multiple sugar transport system ATP-binding protein
MASVTLRRLSKVYDGGVQALHDLDLDVRDGELLVLLGPSGSGKTTVLRCIAGLEEPTSGEVVIGERVVTHEQPAARDVAMVFQTPALYPHLSVRDNIAFPLEIRGVAHAQVARRVLETATRLGLQEVLERLPARL